MSDDIQRVLGQIEGSLTGIHDKLSFLSSTIERHLEDDNKRFGKIDSDVRSINIKMWFGSGFAAALSGVVATSTALFTIWLKGN